MNGDEAIRWTVRLAMALYVVSLAMQGLARDRAARLTWTVGCFAYLAHVACAFHFSHHWSHAEAYASTAQQTFAVTGLDWGGGLYANYAFTLVWIADVCWWWAGIERYRERPGAATRLIHGYLAFIAFNATVVFVAGPVRWIGLTATMLLAILWTRQVLTSARDKHV